MKKILNRIVDFVLSVFGAQAPLVVHVDKKKVVKKKKPVVKKKVTKK